MLELNNKFIMAPLKLGYSDGTGVVTDRHLQFYNRRNKHIGGIIPEPFLYGCGFEGVTFPIG